MKPINCLQIILIVFIILAVVLIVVVKWPILGYILGAIFLLLLIASFIPPAKPLALSPKHLDKLVGAERKLYKKAIEKVRVEVEEKMSDKYKLAMRRYLASEDYEGAIKFVGSNVAKPEEAAARYAFIAQIYILNCRFKEAEEYYLKAVEAHPTLHSISELADFYYDCDKLGEARKYYERCLSMKLTPEQKSIILNNLGMTLRDGKKYSVAEKTFAEALAARRRLAKENPQLHAHDLAKLLDNVGILHQNKEEFEKAADCYMEALKIYRDLAPLDPDKYNPCLAQMLSNLGELYWLQQNFGKAGDFYLDALEIYRRLDAKEPKKYSYSLAVALNNLGTAYGTKGRFDEAEDYLVEALKIRREMARVDPYTYNPAIAETLNNLGNLYMNMNEYPRAEKLLNECLVLSQKLAEERPTEWDLYLTKTLVCTAGFYLRCHPDKALSIKYAKEAIKIIDRHGEFSLDAERREAILILKKWKNT